MHVTGSICENFLNRKLLEASRAPSSLLSQRDPEVFVWPSGFLVACGATAKKPHIFQKRVFVGLGTPGLQQNTWPKTHFGIPVDTLHCSNNYFRFLGFLLWFGLGPGGLREAPGNPGKAHGGLWGSLGLRTSPGPRQKTQKPILGRTYRGDFRFYVSGGQTDNCQEMAS